jgi:hypothetical protein
MGHLFNGRRSCRVRALYPAGIDADDDKAPKRRSRLEGGSVKHRLDRRVRGGKILKGLSENERRNQSATGSALPNGRGTPQMLGKPSSSHKVSPGKPTQQMQQMQPFVGMTKRRHPARP